ncbi:hypothetical protein K3148_03115 [Qipengyuania aurantiaca]|uniref:Uncharacterized protein n=1 Tax=Qipengyuania aurantiaca TaxID=2867233 RepID=A0ABX8ZN05_9SPHN|nr:hypothetical protein [Qipengyuania aurantiaca]QZD90398.1 hypothetical protein K3148_03115 [Qipengyuania aurantiaca]
MSRGQHHKRLAWVTAAGLGLAAVAGGLGIAMPPGETLWHLIAAPQEDGLWEFKTIDGRDVSLVGYSIRVHWGEVSQWYNGCNYCGTSDDGGQICTLQACIERPSDRLYYRFLHGPYTMEVEGDRMVLTVPGHRAVLQRFTEQKF